MANVKITQLPAASTVTANVDVLPMVHSGVTQKVTPDQLVNQVLKSPGAIGNTAPFTGAFTSLSCNTITSNGAATLNGTSIPFSVALVDTTTAQAVANKTLYDAKIPDSELNNFYSLKGSALAGNYDATLPVITSNDVFVFEAATQTLTNKTISGASNTLTSIGNASLTNSSITINGSSVSLGGSVTVSATAANALTIGTGLSGGSYDGSSAVTIAIDSTVATLSGSQTLTNKTISGSSNTLSNIGNAALTNSSITINSTTVSLGGSISIPEMTYPGAGIAVSTGSAWGSSLTAPSGAIVGTSDAQTLTNKTISGGSLNNCPIGAGTASSAAVTTLAISGAVSLSGSTGTSGQVLTSAGAGSAPTWTSVTGTGTVTSVSGTGTVNGLTLTGTVTTSGNLTLGGTLDLSSPPAIGGTTPAAGSFTTLSSTGNTTLGDASADTLTINGAAVSIPNNLNFDSDTLFIDAANNRVGIGTSSPGAKLDVQGGRSYFAANSDAFAAYLRYNSSTAGVFLGSPSANAFQISGSGGGAYLNIASSGSLSLNANAGALTHYFTYNENGGEIGLYNNAAAQGTLIDLSNGITRLLHVLSAGDMYVGIGGGNSTGKVIFKSAGFSDAMTLDASGNLIVGGTVSPSGSGNIVCESATGKVGYSTGAGGTVTQATSKSTAVTLNRPCGQITMNNAALGAGESVGFSLNNSVIGNGDSIIVQSNYGANAGAYIAQATYVNTGIAVIRVTNITGGSLSEACTLTFSVIKGATS